MEKIMIPLNKKAMAVEKQDNSIMENNLNWLINGVDFDARRIEIRGEVNDGMSSFVCRNLLKMSEMSNDPIEIYLSSPGGDAYEGLAIYDACLACLCDIHMIASGKIMSAGFVIYLAGDKRVAAPHTSFMMHSVSYTAEGTAKDHEVEFNEGKRLNNAFLDIAAKRTKRNRKWWHRSVLSHNKFFNVIEATEVGIINAQPVVKPRVVKKVKKKVIKKVAKKGRK
jgi:ATP-dependent Clp protease protease subunit